MRDGKIMSCSAQFTEATRIICWSKNEATQKLHDCTVHVDPINSCTLKPLEQNSFAIYYTLPEHGLDHQPLEYVNMSMKMLKR